MPRGVYDRGKRVSRKLERADTQKPMFKRSIPSIVQNDPNLFQSLKDSVELEAAKNQTPASKLATTLDYLCTLRTQCAHRLAHFDEIIHMLEQERG
jgi:hypothetical protein